MNKLKQKGVTVKKAGAKKSSHSTLTKAWWQTAWNFCLRCFQLRISL